MAITLVEYKNKKPNTRYDPDRKIYIGYKVDVRVGKKRHRANLFPTRQKAEQFINQLKLAHQYKKAGLKPENGRVPKVSELLAARLESLKPNKPEYVRGRRVFREFQEAIGADLPVPAIRKSHFQKYINAKLATGVKQTSVTREFAMVRAAFNHADEMFPEEFEDYVAPRLVRKSKKRRRVVRHVVTFDEMRAVADHLYNLQDAFASRVARMWETAWYLGLRYGEVIKLEKNRFNRNAKIIEASRFKNDDLTTFEPLPDELCDVIEAAIAASDDEKYIFPHKTVYPNKFYEVLKEAVEAAELPYGRERPEQVSFHSLRHSFVTRASEVSDLATTGSLSAHSDATMVAYYSHSTDAKRRELMVKLYRRKNGGDPEIDLEEIFEKVRSGEMDLEQFRGAISGEKLYVGGEKRSRLRVAKA